MSETIATNARYEIISNEFDTVTYVPLSSIEMTDTAPEVEHPTNAGYQEMGRQLAPYLATVIRSLSQ